MPQVIFAPAAQRDLIRIRAFLQSKNPLAAKRAAQAIIQATRILEDQPNVGRFVEDFSEEYREWLIEFGNNGYVARYHYDGGSFVTVLAVWHQKEAGF
jgi:plasmid stabilization system protein ParE